MARIVGIHGIAQETRGPDVLRTQWAPALRDGMVLSGAEPPDEADFAIAFHGNLFRKKGGKAAGGAQYMAATSRRVCAPRCPVGVDAIAYGGRAGWLIATRDGGLFMWRPAPAVSGRNLAGRRRVSGLAARRRPPRARGATRRDRLRCLMS
jgi:hypothetical protein